MTPGRQAMPVSPPAYRRGREVGPAIADVPSAPVAFRTRAADVIGEGSSCASGARVVPSKRRRRSSNAGTTSTAEQWFRDANENVRGSLGSTLGDADPPFYFNDAASACAVPSEDSPRRAFAPLSSGSPSVMRLPASSEANSEGFRSVIDDLTVENRLLRRRLKRYERQHSAHLERDKLFEVYVHRLSPDKRRALEETLRRFSLGVLEPAPRPGLALPPRLHELSINSASISTSKSRQPDSAYASGAVSTPAQASERARQKQATGVGEHKVESYLSDIPAGLLQRSSLVMTDSTKKRLVVRRLEQLFTGKASGRGEHSQPLQQQEVSRSAAQADRSAAGDKAGASGVEGLREARMSWPEACHASETTASDRDPTPGATLQPRDGPAPAANPGPTAASVGGGDALEQRPTRPLDLDLHRAQHAAENIQYILHLGLTFAGPDEKSTMAQEEGWVYLNLLMNMAQLHTLNVTPDYVRASLSELHSNFELSPDGDKVRWRGRTDGRRSGSDADGSAEAVGLASPLGWEDSDYAGGAADGGKSAKRQRLGHRSVPRRPPRSTCASDTSADQPFRHPMVLPPRRKPQKDGRRGDAAAAIRYQPLLSHQPPSEEAEHDGLLDLESSASPAPTEAPIVAWAGQRSFADTSSGERSLLPSKKRGREGPIVFYNQATFFTDLGGDRGAGQADGHAASYFATVTADVVGCTPTSPASCKLDIDYGEALGPAEEIVVDDDDLSMGGLVAPVGLGPGESRGVPTVFAAVDALCPEFEASGIGGVLPSDHFLITVRCRHLVPNGAEKASEKDRGESCLVSLRMLGPPTEVQLADGIDRRDSWLGREGASGKVPLTGQPAVRYEVLEAWRLGLAPSHLPLPSVLMSFSTSEDDSGSSSISVGYSDAASNSAYDDFGSERRRSPSSRRRYDMTSDSDGDLLLDEGSGSSIDLLAAARKLDPETIAEREREFDRHAEPQADEEPVLGSSAATVGGSGDLSGKPSRSPF
ncbi:MAG: hypothetical protein M1832_002526 [Thelocarpon impressellum]|nr:MAG: hypothetical protein M1832_002526 [Thelocarpon impressellum]